MSPRPRLASDADLLNATHRVLGRVGPARLTLADVAAEAGVSAATLVQRFGSKRGLLLALATLGATAMTHEYQQIRSAHPTPLAAIDGVVACWARFAPTPDAVANGLAFLQLDLNDPDFHRLALASARASHRQLRAILNDAVAAGELMPCDTDRLARAIDNLVHGSMVSWAIYREGDVERWIRADVDMLLRPYYAPGAARRRRPPGRRRRMRSRRAGL